MARIDGAKHPGLFARLVYWVARRRLGKVPLPLQIAAHSNAAFAASALYEAAIEKAKRVAPRLRSLAQLEAARLIGCPF